MKLFNAVFISILLSSSFFALAPRVVADMRVRNPIRSVAGSGHGCPCPYDQIVKSNGVVYRCGKTSAWSKPGGEYPTCYQSDTTNKILLGGDIMDWLETSNDCILDFFNCRQVF